MLDISTNHMRELFQNSQHTKRHIWWLTPSSVIIDLLYSHLRQQHPAFCKHFCSETATIALPKGQVKTFTLFYVSYSEQIAWQWPMMNIYLVTLFSSRLMQGDFIGKNLLLSIVRITQRSQMTLSFVRIQMHFIKGYFVHGKG